MKKTLAVIIGVFIMLALFVTNVNATTFKGEACFSGNYGYSGSWVCLYATNLGTTYRYNDFSDAGMNNQISSYMVGGLSGDPLLGDYTCKLVVYRDQNRQGPSLTLDYTGAIQNIVAPDGHTLYHERNRADARNAYFSNGVNTDNKISSADITCVNE